MTAPTPTAAPSAARKRATKPAPLPPVVTYDHAHSTKWTEVYEAESRSRPGQVWRVTFDMRSLRWHCPCPASVACAHIDAARTTQQVRWWSALWHDTDDLTLRHQDRHYAELVARGEASEEDIIAHGCLGDEVQARTNKRAA